MSLEDPPGIRFFHDEAARKYKEQMDWIDALDTKAGILLAAAGVISGLVLTQDSVLLRAPWALGVAVVLTLVATLVLALLAFATRRYQLAPNIEDLWPAKWDVDEEGLRLLVLPGLLKALDINQPKLDQKAAFLFWAGVNLLLGTLLVASYFVWLILVS